MMAIIVYTATYIDPSFNFKNGAVLDGYAGSAARVAAWALYAFAAGSVGTGIWVIAHECECRRCKMHKMHAIACSVQLLL